VRFVQVYKDPHKDPRGWPEGSFLTTTPHAADNARTSCSRGLTSNEHPDSEPWHHGQIGHNQLPRDIMLCALERHGIDLAAAHP
jgi:hypothetical protein